MRRRHSSLLLLAGLLAAASPARAQDAPPPCSEAEHRQFDFWIGVWEVTSPTGELAGHNRIRPAFGGCVLPEDGAMVLAGERPGAEGGTERHRITWTPVGPREVRQLWEVSRDAGRSWSVVFDGRYRKADDG